MLFFFSQNIFGFFFFFFFVLFFLLLFVFIEKGVPSPQRERRSRVFGRGERDKEKRADECREEEEGRGLEYLPLFSRSFSLSLCLEALCVKFLLLVWFLVGDGGLFGLLQRVAPLVLLLHPVHQQHHEEGSKQGAHHSSDNHRWGQTGREQGT